MSVRNPKQEGSNLYDCIPQTGKCPTNCNQCFYNRDGAFYVPIDKPHVPTPEEVGDGIVRMNCGHDSNLQRTLVVETAELYKHYFFNTAFPTFDFPAPVVFTANRKEEMVADVPSTQTIPSAPQNLMYVRLRVSASNLHHIDAAVRSWTYQGVPVVLTFMAFYTSKPTCGEVGLSSDECYEWKVRHINSYWCPTREFMRRVLIREKSIGDERYGGRLVTLCGNLDSYKCADCRNCETYYWQTIKHLQERKIIKVAGTSK